jgi:hypothetical protein
MFVDLTVLVGVEINECDLLILIGFATDHFFIATDHFCRRA